MSEQLPAVKEPVFDLATIEMSTKVDLLSSGKVFSVTPDILREWAAPGAPDIELKKFLVAAKHTGLNPILNEIELINMGGKWVISIRKDGYVKMALDNPLYNGYESGIVIQKADGEGDLIDIPGMVVPLASGYILKGGWCKVYRRNIDRPAYKRVGLTEYVRNTPIWKDNKPLMICKVAIAHAHREFVPQGAYYDEAELPITASARPANASIYTEDDHKAEQGKPDNVSANHEVLTPELVEDEPATQQEEKANNDTTEPTEIVPGQRQSHVVDIDYDPDVDLVSPFFAGKIKSIMSEIGMTSEQAKSALAKRGVTKLAALTASQANELYKALEAKAEEIRSVPF